MRWYRTGNYWLAPGTGLALGHSLTHHYPHLEIYLGFITLISVLAFHPAIRKHLVAKRALFAKQFAIGFLPALILGGLVVGFNFTQYFDKLVSPARLDTLGVAYDQIERLSTNSLDPRTLLTYVFPWKSILMDLPSDNIPVDRIPYYLGWLGLFFAGWETFL